MDKEKKQITSLPGFKSNICATSLKNPDYHNIYCQKKKMFGAKTNTSWLNTIRPWK